MDAKCSEPRDKVYGFLGLANDYLDDSFEVDYSKSLFKIYEDVIKFYCQTRSLQTGNF
jgi:hypothetical protein